MKNISIMLDEILAPLFNTEKGRYFGMGALALAGILFFSSLIQMFVTWHADAVISNQKPVSVSHDEALNEAAVLISQIPAMHLFGQAGDDDFLPITSLQVHLTGIIEMPDSHMSRAIISEGGQPGKIFNVGDEFISGIKIYAINPDNVVIEHNGHLEKLPLARQPLQFQDLPQPLWDDK